MSNVIPFPTPNPTGRPLAPLMGVGGLKESGKDAMSEYIAEHYGATVLNMSAPLVRAMLALNPIIPLYVPGVNVKWIKTGQYTRYRDLHESVGYTKAKNNPEVRRLYQVLGTEVGRDMIDQDTWVNIARRDIQALREDGESTIITGIRFGNERDMIQAQGGHLVWVERDPDYHNREIPEDAHASERTLTYEDFDVTVENFGTLEGLYKSAETVWDDVTLKAGRQHPANPNWHGTRYDF